MIKEIPYQDTLAIRQTVLWPNKKIAELILKNDSTGKHFGYFISNELVSIISLFITSDSAQFRKFATLPDHQNQGYGTELLKYVLKYAQEAHVNHIWCNARVTARDFYAKFGLFEKDNSLFIKDNIEYIIMENKTT